MPAYDHLSGNDHVKAYLTRLLETGRIGHAFLFAGPPGSDKPAFAHTFARELLGVDHHHKIDAGNHPDVHWYKPEGKLGQHSVDSLRRFNSEVRFPPNEAPYKVFILEEAERMPPVSANALLKTFEEPPPQTVIILITDHPSSLLPTILSRCRTLRFEGAAQESDPLTGSLLEALDSGALGNYGYLRGTAQSLAESLEAERVATVEMALDAVKEHKLGASATESAERAAQGAAAHRLRDRMQELLSTALSYERDRHLLRVGGSPDYLLTPAPPKDQGALRPLGAVELAVKDTLLALDRSTPLQLVWEGFFLRWVA